MNYIIYPVRFVEANLSNHELPRDSTRDRYLVTAQISHLRRAPSNY